jgi:HD-like signal output (HDOD) protein
MQPSNHYNVYRSVISRVLSDSERLPSLPSITLKIRQAMSEENTTADSLAKIITKDPALSALLLKSASSPMYKRTVAPNTLAEVIGMLGFANTNNLVMLHSVRSVFVMSSPKAKTLFAHTWRRLIVKLALSVFIAKQLRFRPAEHAQMVALLSEVGSLAVLSALIEQPQIPDDETYFQLCRHYSKSLGSILLNKWNIDPLFINAVKNTGGWTNTEVGEINLVDIMNLALYYTVLMTNNNANLPDLAEITAYQKLPKHLKSCTKDNWLSWILDNKADIQEIVKSFK